MPNCRHLTLRYPNQPLAFFHHTFLVPPSQTRRLQSLHNSPTVQHRKLHPSSETDPKSAANHFGGSLKIRMTEYTNKQQKQRPHTRKSARQTAVTAAKSLFM